MEKFHVAPTDHPQAVAGSRLPDRFGQQAGHVLVTFLDHATKFIMFFRSLRERDRPSREPYR
jgi:hypothetical protein